MQREQRRSSRGLGRALAFSGALALAFTGSGAAFASSANSVAAAEWALNTLNVTQVRNLGAHGAGVVVAVIDSGVDPNQPDLKGRLVDGVNLVNPSDPTSDYSDASTDSHGTSVATVIAGYPHTASDGSSYGMIGLADKADIMPVRVSDLSAIGSYGATVAGVEYAVNHGAQVINISLGESSDISTPQMTSAINMALSHGVVVVVAAGNDANSGNSASPYATIPGVLDVAGIDSNGQKYSFGHYGSDVNIAAPANSIEVGTANGQYSTNSGTSFSAPWVAGEAALLIAAHPTWSSGQIVATIIDNTQQVASGTTKSGQRYNDDFGYGVIDPVTALQASEPSSAANPLGGPAITSNPAENVKNSASASATSGTTPTATAGKSSSKMPLIIGIVVAVVVVVGLLIFLLSRGNRNRGGKGGPGGGGGGGGNGYYPPQAPPPGGAGQYGQPAPGQYGQPQAPQYQPQQPNPYPPQQQPQQPQQGYPPQHPPQQGPGGPGGYGQQNPYSGR